MNVYVLFKELEIKKPSVHFEGLERFFLSPHILGVYTTKEEVDKQFDIERKKTKEPVQWVMCKLME